MIKKYLDILNLREKRGIAKQKILLCCCVNAWLLARHAYDVTLQGCCGLSYSVLSTAEMESRFPIVGEGEGAPPIP